MKRLVHVWLLLAMVVMLSALGVAPTMAADKQRPDAPVQGKVVPNHYIVKLKDNARVDALLAGGGIKAKHVYAAVLNGFAAELNPQQLQALQRNPNVELIEQDAEVTADATQSPVTWGLDRIDQQWLPLSNSYTYNSTGPTIHAYIIDTGIQASHPDFGGRAVNVFNSAGLPNDDCNGHGTHVAGTVGSATYGVAKQVRLYGVKVLNCGGSGTWSGVIAGMDWVAVNAQRPAVANLSLGGGYNASVNAAATNLSNSGVFVAVAAGNSYGANACNYSPASAANVTTVGATTINDTIASFSNIGACVEIYAPGERITSTYPTSTTAILSGTSMASPHVAGVAVLYKATYGDAPWSTINSWLVGNGTPLSFGRLLYTNGL